MQFKINKPSITLLSIFTLAAIGYHLTTFTNVSDTDNSNKSKTHSTTDSEINAMLGGNGKVENSVQEHLTSPKDDQSPKNQIDYHALLLTQSIDNLSRDQLTKALETNPEQLIEYLKADPNLNFLNTRLLLDVVYRFSDQYRTEVAFEMMHASFPTVRSAGYRLLANASSEDLTHRDYHLDLIIDASFTETEPNVIADLLTIFSETRLNDKQQQNVESRLATLVDNQDSEIRVNALSALVKISNIETVAPIISGYLNNRETTPSLTVISALFEVEKPTAELLNQVRSVVDNKSFSEDIRQEAQAVLRNWM
ncbi:hypothetical protein [Saccharobesus litoralis]|nr:hypothetical protein [Saccharobesus litoralis]